MPFLYLLGVCAGLAMLIGGPLGIAAFVRVRQLEDEVRRQQKELEALRLALRRTAAHAEAAHVEPVTLAPAEKKNETTNRAAVFIEKKTAIPEKPVEPFTEPIPKPTLPAPVSQFRPVAPPPARVLKPESPIKPEPVASQPRAAKPDVDAMENLIGKRLTWVGLGVLFLGLAFFAKFAYDQGWFGRMFPPPMRIAALLAVAAGMLGIGGKFRKDGMLSLGSSLLGGGLAVAYLAIYAGLSPRLSVVAQPLFTPTAAFLSMSGITAAGVVLALLLDARSTSIIAVIGGFLTPVLISTGENSRDALFSYLMILDVGVFAVAFYRKWRALDVVTFLGTAMLFVGWFANYYHTYPAHPNWPTLLWLGVFHALFLGIAFAYHWRTRTALTLERFVLVLGNLAWGLGYAAVILKDHRLLAATIAAVLAFVYLMLAIRSKRLQPSDERSFHSFVAISTMLMVLSTLDLLPTEGVASGWLVESIALLYLGYRYSYQPTRWSALLVLVLGAIRSFAYSPGHSVAFTAFLNGTFLKLALVPIVMAIFAYVHQRFATNASQEERKLKYLIGTLSGLIFLGIDHYEIFRYFGLRQGGHVGASAEMIASMMWSIGALGYVFFAWAKHNRPVFAVAIVPWAIAAVTALSAYAVETPNFTLGWNLRFCAAIVNTAVVFVAFRAARKSGTALLQQEVHLQALGVVAQLVALAYASIEVVFWGMDHYRSDPDPQRYVAWMLDVLWCVAGTASVLYGRRVESLGSIWTGLCALMFGSALSLTLFFNTWPSSLMFLNQRFIGIAIGIASLATAAKVLKDIGKIREDQRKVPAVLVAMATTVLWLALTCEPATWFVTNLTDSARAHRLATFSITLVWIVFASVMLAVGFVRHWRRVRLTALGLLLVTVAKILLVDMAGAQQLWRIASFIITGVVLIGASYAYHRAERYLEGRSGGDGKSS